MSMRRGNHYRKIVGLSKALLIAMLFLIILCSLSGCGGEANGTPTAAGTAPVVRTIKTPISAEECVGKPFSDIKKKFEDAGFTAVSVYMVEDLKANQAELIDTVLSVTIDGKSDFSANQDFEESSRIDIQYHGYAKCPIKLNVDFVGNWLFSKYDVILMLDGIEKAIMEHGEGGDFEFEVYPGNHTISFEKEDDSDVNGSLDLEVTGEVNVSVRITCHSGNVDIETIYLENLGAVGEGQALVGANASDFKSKSYSEIFSALSTFGFTNITTEAVYDSATGNSNIGVATEVLIDGKNDFKRGDIFAANVAVVIKYHEDEAKDPVKIAAAEALEKLKENLPRAMAERAIVVAMTNGQATDVFASDGNTYDVSKFYSYSDIGDFFMTIEEDGTWTAVDENTWHVEGIVLRIYNFDTYVEVSCNVTKNRDNYIVFNVDRAITSKENIGTTDPTKTNIEHWEPSNTNIFLTVPSSLITENRDEAAAQKKMTAKEQRQKWIESQFHWWDGRHIALSDLIKDNLNDSKSFEHVDASFIDVCDEESKAIVNDLLKSSGFKQRVDIGDLFVIEIFTAKNAFNATIKSTGYGIVYSDGSVVLLAIE